MSTSAAGPTASITPVAHDQGPVLDALPLAGDDRRPADRVRGGPVVGPQVGGAGCGGERQGQCGAHHAQEGSTWRRATHESRHRQAPAGWWNREVKLPGGSAGKEPAVGCGIESGVNPGSRPTSHRATQTGCAGGIGSQSEVIRLNIPRRPWTRGDPSKGRQSSSDRSEIPCRFDAIGPAFSPSSPSSRSARRFLRPTKFPLIRRSSARRISGAWAKGSPSPARRPTRSRSGPRRVGPGRSRRLPLR